MYDKQIQPVTIAAVSAPVAFDDGMARNLPVEADRDEERGAVGGAVGGEASYSLIIDASRAASHEVILQM